MKRRTPNNNPHADEFLDEHQQDEVIVSLREEVYYAIRNKDFVYSFFF